MQTTTVARDYLRGLALQCQDAFVGRFTDGAEHIPARYLKIQVRRNGTTRVQLSFPADAIERLDDLLSDEVKERIAQHGANLVELVDVVRRRNFTAGPVFSMQRDEKQVDVWLE